MGNSNSIVSSISLKEVSIISEEELEIIQNNLVYNFKISLISKNRTKNIKITISFLSNKSFEVFEKFFIPNKGLKNDNNVEQNYHKLISLIKDERLQIQHESNNFEKYILFTFENNEMENVKLFPSLMNEKDKANILINNYRTLQKNYIEL